MAEAVSMEEIYGELKKIEVTMVTKEDMGAIMEALVDSRELRSNPTTLKKIHRSEQAIIQGKIKEIHSVKDMLDELEG